MCSPAVSIRVEEEVCAQKVSNLKQQNDGEEKSIANRTRTILRAQQHNNNGKNVQTLSGGKAVRLS